MEVVNWWELSPQEQEQRLQRPAVAASDGVVTQVADIISAVRNKGDAALFAFTEKFDQVTLDSLVIDLNEINNLEQQLPAKLITAIEQAWQNINHFHTEQIPKALMVETMPGIECSKQYRPIHSVGLYVPSGSAPLISTALMLAIPAKLAGCEQIVLCAPVQKSGEVHPAILYVAKRCGIDKIYTIGGAQAIAAMAYGTKTVPKVDKIFGPGNQWVTQAKLQVAVDPNGASYDLPAGPSEVLVIADAKSNAEFVAADLLSQAEHGVDSQLILCCLSVDFARQVIATVNSQLHNLARKDIAEQALLHSRFIVVDTIEQAIAISNEYAPEHLILQVEEPNKWQDKITRAGSVFLGQWAPESVGDYASGTNHVLPTYGYAKSIGGLGLTDFMLQISMQQLTANSLVNLSATVETLAAAEGLTAHENAVKVRRKRLGQNNVQETKNTLPKPRSEIATMRAYSSARNESDSKGVMLNANENPDDILLNKGFNRYPNPQPQQLLACLSNLYQVQPEQLLVARGSDEAIDILLRVYCRAYQDAIMLCEPTYGMYEVSANIQAARIIRVALSKPDFDFKVEDLIKAWQPEVKLVFICSPNNPVGNCVKTDDVLRLCDYLAGKALVVVDEAYVEFANQTSLSSKLSEYDNLVVLRTLSKAYGLAGVRCGCLLANPVVIQLLLKVLAPYPLPTPAIDSILQALTAKGLENAKLQIKTLILDREKLIAELKSFDFVERVWASEANFILFRVRSAVDLMAYCGKHGITIRDRSNQLGLDNCLRVSVGNKNENQLLLTVLRQYNG